MPQPTTIPLMETIMESIKTMLQDHEYGGMCGQILGKTVCVISRTRQ